MATNWQAVEQMMTKSQAKATDLLVLIAIARHADRKTGECWPSRDTIADMAHCDASSVRRSLRRLEDLGELQVTINGGPSTLKTNHPNLYRVLIYDVSEGRGGKSPPEDIGLIEAKEKRKERPSQMTKEYSWGGEMPSRSNGYAPTRTEKDDQQAEKLVREMRGTPSRDIDPDKFVAKVKARLGR